MPGKGGLLTVLWSCNKEHLPDQAWLPNWLRANLTLQPSPPCPRPLPGPVCFRICVAETSPTLCRSVRQDPLWYRAQRGVVNRVAPDHRPLCLVDQRPVIGGVLAGFPRHRPLLRGASSTMSPVPQISPVRNCLTQVRANPSNHATTPLNMTKILLFNGAPYCAARRAIRVLQPLR